MPVVKFPEEEISAMLRERIEVGDFPSAVYVVGDRGEAVFSDALGEAVREPESQPATVNTIYDLASLTKPLVTGLLSAILFERGELTLDGPVARYLPEFDRSDKRTITITQLLTHTSGLPAWRPLYLLAETKDETLPAIANLPLEDPPGTRVIYSDLGFIALGFLIQRLTGMSLTGLAEREIFSSLSLRHSFFNPSAATRTGVAACESGNAYERVMCERDFPKAKYTGWRDEVIWGEVHDGNAHFLAGVAGHAGLFANAQDAMRLANQFVPAQTELLARTTCALFQKNLTVGLNEARSFAWQLAATRDSTAGPDLPANAFGHTGFTGASCWVDADQQRIFILLTNRTHARKLPFANINAVRREFHSIAVRALDSRA